MSDSTDPHRPEDEASIQIDVWGIKLRAASSAEHHKAADDEEDHRQAALEKREQQRLPEPEVDDPETGLAERLEALEAILDELRAEGIAVQASDLGEQRVALYLVSPEQVDVARAIVEEEFLPKLEADLAADVLTQPISYLNLSARAERGLNELGVSTIADLLQRTAGELLAVKGFGEATLAEVRQKLGDVQLKLRGD